VPHVRIGGTEVNYYLSCKTKLWLAYRHICCEHTSELVRLGKILHEETLKDYKREIVYDEIAIDVMRNKKEIVEIKRGKKVRESDIYQLLYYLYYLEKNDVHGFTGTLYYPRIQKQLTLELTEDEKRKIEEILQGIKETVMLDSPPPPQKCEFCNGCAYYEFCFC